MVRHPLVQSGNTKVSAGIFSFFDVGLLQIMECQIQKSLINVLYDSDNSNPSAFLIGTQYGFPKIRIGPHERDVFTR